MTKNEDFEDDGNHHASKLKGLLWLSAALLTGGFMAVGISPLVRAVPWSWEQSLSETIPSVTPDETCRKNPAADQILQKIVTRLYPVDAEDKKFTINVKVVKNNTVNAYAGLGGNIFINSALLAKAHSPEEIAGVLAHEIEHVQHRDILYGFVIHALTSQGLQLIFSGDVSAGIEWADYFLSMRFSRKQEAWADKDGLVRLQKAHINNTGFKDFFRRMEEENSTPEFLSDHPSNRSREDMVDSVPNENTKPLMSEADWLILKTSCSK